MVQQAVKHLLTVLRENVSVSVIPVQQQLEKAPPTAEVEEKRPPI